MNTYKIGSFLGCCLIFLLASCGQQDTVHQEYVETLSASQWAKTSHTVNGEERDHNGTIIEHTQIHEPCTLAEGDCMGSNSYTLHSNDGSVSRGGSTFSYKIHDGGKMMTVTTINVTKDGVTTPCESDCETVMEIVEWSDDKHVLKIVDGDDVHIRTMERSDHHAVNKGHTETLTAGDWKLTSATLNGEERNLGGTLIEHVQKHDPCDPAEEDCKGSKTYTLELEDDGGTETGGSTFTYRVHGGGKYMIVNTISTTKAGATTPCTSGCETVMEIVEWSDTKHVVKIVDGDDIYIRTMERT